MGKKIEIKPNDQSWAGVRITTLSCQEKDKRSNFLIMYVGQDFLFGIDHFLVSDYGYGNKGKEMISLETTVLRDSDWYLFEDTERHACRLRGKIFGWKVKECSCALDKQHEEPEEQPKCQECEDECLRCNPGVNKDLMTNLKDFGATATAHGKAAAVRAIKIIHDSLGEKKTTVEPVSDAGLGSMSLPPLSEKGPTVGDLIVGRKKPTWKAPAVVRGYPKEKLSSELFGSESDAVSVYGAQLISWPAKNPVTGEPYWVEGEK